MVCAILCVLVVSHLSIHTRITMSADSISKSEAIGNTVTQELSSDNSSDFLAHDPSKPYIDLTVVLDEAELKRRASWWYQPALFLWDSIDKSKEERAFMFKLDFFLLSAGCLGYFIKNLDQNNVGTAYVNGMKEHYNMEGNDYNIMVTLWTVGYIIGQIPSNLILHRISARYYMGGLEFVWGCLTLLIVAPKNLSGIYGLRFLIGLTESGYFPGMEYLLGSWYSKKEIGKRACFLACAGTASNLISGPLQQAILTSSWAHQHLEPFQWMFIIDAAITFPIALYTVFSNPNTPSTVTAWYFSETDKLVGLERRRRQGSQLNTREPYTLKKIASFFNTWHIFLFPFLFLCFHNSGQPATSQAFQLWMKTTLQLDSYYYNTYPTIISGAGIGLALVVCYSNDYCHAKLTPYFLFTMFACVIFGSASLSVWEIPVGLHWASYFLLQIPLSVGQPLIFSWVNGLLHHDDMKRNFVVVVTNTLAYVTSAWVPMLTFNQVDAPEFNKGFTYNACLSSIGILTLSAIVFFDIRDKRRAAREPTHDDTEKASLEEKEVYASFV